MLHGFHIAQFRNFGDEENLVGPLSKVNIFIGGNNSGKSNVLRFVRDIIAPLINRDRDKPIKADGINRSRYATAPRSYVNMLARVSSDHIVDIFKPNRAAQAEAWHTFFRNLPGSLEGGEYTTVPIRKSVPNGSQRVDQQALTSQGVDQHTAQQIWVTGGQSSGNFAQHWYPDILQRLLEEQVGRIDCVYVPAFRQLDTRLEKFAHEYRLSSEGEHIIDELAAVASPTYENQDKKTSFEKLRAFIGDIVGRPNVQIEIPYDKSTINVNLDGQVLPIEALGSGIHELFMLASQVVLNEGKVVLLEEPEVHMHPEFQRKFMLFIRDNIDSQFFITTHSAVIIDTDGAKVFGVSSKDGEAAIAPLLEDQSRREMCRELGYRASDLLQANSIVWVEGPSDRIYLKHWLHEIAPDLREGIEFSIMFYGGKLLSHLSAEDAEVEDFISLLPINRYSALLVDSDLGRAGQPLRPTKQRVLDELSRVGGFGWVTAGREVETYVPYETRAIAVKRVHPRALSLVGARNRWGKPLDYQTAAGETVTDKFDKVRIAREVSKLPSDLTQLDLGEKLDGLASFIRRANCCT
ncbi:ATP-binding protein [Sphingosinicella sp. LY1275]|uniref:AAA family ATPase n=1 Tax=Sphingosinicella sp. LY1275 TaxID=3095379 RepID=UPI002ADEEB1D|nr:ATP-binding protein [Sphingosinicella sp. LY1275]MEA1015038.1 ATP-binding protein [Sphingosinicella sp. LY1275]